MHTKTFAESTASYFRQAARRTTDPDEQARLLAAADGVESDDAAPTPDDVLADKRLYTKLQQDAQAREDLALVEPLEQRITTPRTEPRFVGGRWIS